MKLHNIKLPGIVDLQANIWSQIPRESVLVVKRRHAHLPSPPDRAWLFADFSDRTSCKIRLDSLRPRITGVKIHLNREPFAYSSPQQAREIHQSIVRHVTEELVVAGRVRITFQIKAEIALGDYHNRQFAAETTSNLQGAVYLSDIACLFLLLETAQ